MAILALGAAFLPHHHPAAAPGSLPAADIAWMLVSTALVLLMTPGLAFFYGGMVNRGNIISTMLQSFISLGVISLLWYVVGFSLAFGDDIGGVIGDPRTFFMFNNVGTAPHPTLGAGLPLVLFAAFQLKFAIITPALITGGFAERIRFWGYLIFICLFSLLIYCPLAHWTWHPDGFLYKWGVLDFAGGTVVHISAGFAALAGALAIGRRHSHLDGHAHAPVNIPFVILGTGLLWFGWFGFNAGSALGANAQAVQAFVTTHFASAARHAHLDAAGSRPRAAALSDGSGRGRGGGAGGHHAGGGLRGLRAGHCHRYSGIGRELRGRDSEKPNHPGRYARRVSVPRRGAASWGCWPRRFSPKRAACLPAVARPCCIRTCSRCWWWARSPLAAPGFLYQLTNLIVPIRVNAENEIHGLDTSQHGETMLAA